MSFPSPFLSVVKRTSQSGHLFFFFSFNSSCGQNVGKPQGKYNASSVSQVDKRSDKTFNLLYLMSFQPGFTKFLHLETVIMLIINMLWHKQLEDVTEECDSASLSSYWEMSLQSKTALTPSTRHWPSSCRWIKYRGIKICGSGFLSSGASALLGNGGPDNKQGMGRCTKREPGRVTHTDDGCRRWADEDRCG